MTSYRQMGHVKPWKSATPPPVELVVSDIVLPEKLGTQLVREVAYFSPRTACVLMTAGIMDSADVPVGGPVLRKPFAKRALISVVQATLARPVQARADLRYELEKSAELLRQNAHLRAETAEAIGRPRYSRASRSRG